MSSPVEPIRSVDDAAALPARSRPFARHAVGVLAAAVVAGAAVFGVLSLSSPRYVAESRLLIAPAYTGEAADPAALLSGQRQLVTSPDLVRRVADRLHLEADGEFSTVRRNLLERLLVLVGVRADAKLDAPEVRTVRAVRDRLEVVPTTGAAGLTVRFASSDRQRAADVANAVVDEYRALQDAAPATSPDRMAVRVIAAARPPAAPSSPDPWLWAAVVAVAAALGAGLVSAVVEANRAARPAGDSEPLPEVAVCAEPPASPAALPPEAVSGSAELRARRFRERLGQAEEATGASAAVAEALPEIAADDPATFLSPHGLYAMLLADGTSRVAFIGLSDAVAGRRTIDSLSLNAAADGERVVVIETDPAIDETAGPGISDLILGSAGFGEIIRRNPLTRAHEIGVGSRPLGPAVEESEALRTMLEALEHTYDLVLMDLGMMRADRVLIAFMGLAERIVLVGDPDNGNVAVARDILRRHGFRNVVLTESLAAGPVGAVA